MYQSLGFFVISVVCFIVLAMSVSILTPKREGFKESRDKSFVKKVETVLDGKLFGIRKHIQSNKQLLKNHTNILSSIESHCVGKLSCATPAQECSNDRTWKH